MKPVQSFNHMAVLTRDSAATYQFYTEVMGFRLVSAVQADAVPSTGDSSSFLHTFYALADGSCMAFFELTGVDLPIVDDHVPAWVRHFSMNVDSRSALEAWRAHLVSHGVETTEIIDHEGIWQSIYFFDPNGLRLELTWQARDLDEDDAARGEQLLKVWSKAHAVG